MKKFIISTVISTLVLLINICFSIKCLIYLNAYLPNYHSELSYGSVSNIFEFIFEYYSWLEIPFLCILVLLFVSASVIVLWIIVFLQSPMKYKIKYTYEEYKTKMDEKKALKQAHKKEKLKQKLNELEKGE